jgi:hypothetical protein
MRFDWEDIPGYLIAIVLRTILFLMIGFPLFLYGRFAEGWMDRIYSRFGRPARKETMLVQGVLFLFGLEVLTIGAIIALYFLVFR